MANRKLIPGKFVWFELVTRDARRAQAFYGEVLGWKVQPFSMGADTYEMITTSDRIESMIGGYASPKDARQPAHWISYVSVEDVDAAAKAATANGGRIVEAPYDIPQVGRAARIADPQGAELCLFRNSSGDPEDALPAKGGWCWNELHTTDPAKALAFYEKVVGFSHRTVSNPPVTYHILSRGGVDRGGVTDEGGGPPAWLPYVAVDDADATVARANKNGGTICFGPADIPNVGRFAVLQDPTGASFAVLKPILPKV
jgi:uncharacterized protein